MISPLPSLSFPLFLYSVRFLFSFLLLLIPYSVHMMFILYVSLLFMLLDEGEE